MPQLLLNLLHFFVVFVLLELSAAAVFAFEERGTNDGAQNRCGLFFLFALWLAG